MTIKQRIITFFVLVLSSFSLIFYYFFIYDPLPPNVEIVVSTAEKPSWLSLSPQGDKILYNSNASPSESYEIKLLNLKTQQIQTLGKCGYSWWVNDTLIRCQASDNAPTFLVNTDDFSQLPVQILEADNPQLLTILQQAGKIYRYSPNRDKDSPFFFVLSEDKNKPNQNYQINSLDIDATLKGFTYTQVNLFPPFPSTGSIRVYSPNQKYYFKYSAHGRPLAIYEATTHQQVVKYESTDSHDIEFGGWAWDNSGVYFKGYEVSVWGGRPAEDFPILKLVIPKQD